MVDKRNTSDTICSFISCYTIFTLCAVYGSSCHRMCWIIQWWWRHKYYWLSFYLLHNIWMAYLVGKCLVLKRTEGCLNIILFSLKKNKKSHSSHKSSVCRTTVRTLFSCLSIHPSIYLYIDQLYILLNPLWVVGGWCLLQQSLGERHDTAVFVCICLKAHLIIKFAWTHKSCSRWQICIRGFCFFLEIVWSCYFTTVC